MSQTFFKESILANSEWSDILELLLNALEVSQGALIVYVAETVPQIVAQHNWDLILESESQIVLSEIDHQKTCLILNSLDLEKYKHKISIIRALFVKIIDYRNLKNRLDELKLDHEQKLKHLQIHHEIAYRLAANMDMDSVIPTILDIAWNAFECYAALFFIVENDQVYAAGVKGENILSVDQEINESCRALLYRILNHSDVLTHDHVTEEELQKAFLKPRLNFLNHGFLGVSLHSKDRLLGVLILITNKKRSSESEKELLMTLANQSSLAIDDLVSHHQLKMVNHELLNQQEQLLKTSRQLEYANKELKELSVLKSKFISMVSHELKTPLTSIKEAISLVHTEMLGGINEDQKRILGIGRKDVALLERMINDLLQLSRMESGRMPLEMCQFTLSEVIDKAKQHFEWQMKDKKMTLEVHLTSDLPLLYADKDRIFQVLVNLISNSIKFSRESTPVLIHTEFYDSIRMQSYWQQIDPLAKILGPVQLIISEKSYVEFSVQDKGFGVAKEDWRRIFLEFEQLPNERSREHAGVGLGLAIVRKIVSDHNGFITMDSQIGIGTSIHIFLPIEAKK